MTEEKLPTMREVEKSYIIAILEHTRWNRTKASKILGISIRTLRNKLDEYRAEGLNVKPNLDGRGFNPNMLGFPKPKTEEDKIQQLLDKGSKNGEVHFATNEERLDYYDNRDAMNSRSPFTRK